LIQYLAHDKIDKAKWDRCVEASPNGMVYGLSWYLDIVSPGWEGLADEDYTSVFPLTCRRKLFIHYLYQPFFTQQCGLFSTEQNIGEKKINRFLDAIPEKFRLIEIQLNTGNSIQHADGFEINNRVTHHLSLAESKERLHAMYSQNVKRNLKKAAESSVEVTHVEPEDVVNLFRKNRGKNIATLGRVEYETLAVLLKAAGERKLLTCLGAYDSDRRLVAGAIFLKSIHSHIFLLSGQTQEGRNIGGMSAVINSFIMGHVHENYYLDFEGSMDPNLARFYKSFGSEEVVYLQIRKNKLPAPIRWFK